MAFVDIRINARDVIQDIEELAGAIELANRSAVARIQEGLRSIVVGSLEIAMQEAGAAFHPIYQNHLRRGLASIYPAVFATPDGLVAQYYDLEGLGDYGDLEEGFHYHAILDVDKEQFSVGNRPWVELPYGGEALYNDQNQRYDYWQKLVNGEDVEVQFKGHKKTFSTAGLYEQTLRARVNYWGDRYPEWLLLEYGTDYYPNIPATHVKYFTEQRITEYMQTIYEEILDEIVSAWNRPGGRGTIRGQFTVIKGTKLGAGGKQQAFDIRGRYARRI